MARTVFVNPSLYANPRKKAKKGGKRKAKKAGRRKAAKRVTWRALPRGARKVAYRNAGIAPFVQNPLIMSNPPRRRRARRSNPLAGLNLRNVVSRGLTYGGGSAIAVAENVFLLNGIGNFWLRNGLRFGSAVVGAGFLKGELGASHAGAMFYPLMQELYVKFVGKPAGTEADLEALAADLEDVMDDLDEVDLSDDEEFADDVDDILS